MKVFRVEESPYGFRIRADGSEDVFFGENIFIAIGRWAVYFPKFFQIVLSLEGDVWRVKKRFGFWDTLSGEEKYMTLSFPSGFEHSLVSLDDLLDLLGSFLYTVRLQIDVDFRWKDKQEFFPGYGEVLSFQTERKRHRVVSL